MARSEGIPRRWRTTYQAVLLFAAPLLVGGVHPPVILALAVLGLGFACLIGYHAQATGRRFHVPWIGWLLAGLTGWTALQLVPLPLSWLGWIAPATAELYRFVLDDLPAGLFNSWQPISLDAGATGLELAKLAGLTALVVGAANTHHKPGSREVLLFVLALVGGLVAVLALSGLALESSDFLGLYDPTGAWDPQVAHGPFVNPNHLAGFLGLCAYAAFGHAAVSRAQRGQGAFVATLGALAVAGLVLSGSRGALLAFGVTLPLFVMLLVRARRGAGGLGRAPLLILAVLLLGAAVMYPELTEALSFIGDAERLPEDQKIQSWAAALTQIGDNPLVGTGRGAFAVAHTRYKTLPVNVRFTHVENEALQALADWGVPVGLAAVAAFAWLLIGLTRRRELRTIDAGMIAGLWFLALHNLVDFNLEFLGVGIPAAIVLGMLVRPAARPGTRAASGAPASAEATPPPGTTPRPSSRLVRGAPQALLVALLLFGLLGGLRYLTGDGPARLEELRQVARRSESTREQIVQASARAQRVLPADYLGAQLTARAMLPRARPRPEFTPQEALHQLNRALFLNPTSPGAHLLTARLLMALGRRTQALPAYRAAVRFGAPQTPLIRELLARRLTLPELLLALPARPDELRLLTTALLERHRWLDADQVLAWLMQYPDARPVAAARRASLALEHFSPELALRRCRDLLAANPGDSWGHYLHGRALARSGRPDEAIAAWQEATRLDPRQDRAWSAWLELLARQQLWDQLGEVLERFRPHATGSERAAGSYFSWKGRLAAEFGNLTQAILAYDQAAVADPLRFSHALSLAALREQIGDLHGALAALRVAASRGAGKKAEERIRALRARHPHLLPQERLPAPPAMAPLGSGAPARRGRTASPSPGSGR